MAKTPSAAKPRKRAASSAAKAPAAAPAHKRGAGKKTPRSKPLPGNVDITPLSPLADDPDRQAIRLSFLVHDVSRMRRTAFDQLMRPLNITRARWWVLAHLSRHDGMMQSQLADVLEVGKASLGSVIEQLEAANWVERRGDPLDKRAKRVFLSRSAQALIKRMIQEEHKFNQFVLAKLTLEERAELQRLLGLVKESLGDLISAGKSEQGSLDD